ncbi:MAG: RdgB/HAM1 family non-canonical purine NTP pyrophosphatase [Planctomycetes bacterium]|nr:RdgB/HAM1 family non-canonical purine NTP pyrophosphatase [Planctomycetota bacterium]
MTRLLLASENKKKLAELTRLLAPLDCEVVLPSSIGGLPKVDEDQMTFRGNAEKKASSAARASGLWTLADDSGLAVDALNGAPGVLSARFAGTHGDDAANNALLLAKLDGLPDARRGARFVCTLALARPDGAIALSIEGMARGKILFAPRGDGGFGYDPLFLFTEPGFPQTGKGFAELSLDDKSSISHRGRALAELVRRLPRVAGFTNAR